MPYDEIALSDYGKASCIPSPVSRMMAAFASDFRPDKDINVGVGYVNEATIPRERIREAMDAVLAHPERYRSALNYGGPHGSPNLVQSLKRFLAAGGSRYKPETLLRDKQIIIGPSGTTSILEGIAQVLRPGIVITPDPMYYIYCNYLERRGYRICTVPEDENGIRIDLLDETLQRLGPDKKKISFLYIVTVNNPTGTILSNQRRRLLVERVSALSREADRKIPLVFDAAYEDLIHDPGPEPTVSGLVYDSIGCVYETGTLSKILSPALRIGYMLGSTTPFLQAMIQKTSDVGFSAPLITQEIAAYLLDHYGRQQVAFVNEGYRNKARQVCQWLDGLLGDVLADRSGGRAGFYFYLTFKSVVTAEGSPFFRYLTRTTGVPAIDGPQNNKNTRVLYLPGQYCVHPNGPLVEKGSRQLRLSYGYEDTERLHTAIRCMREAAVYASGCR